GPSPSSARRSGAYGTSAKAVAATNRSNASAFFICARIPARMDVRVKRWIELQDAVFADSWRPRIQRHRSSFVFRGVPRVSHTLDTSLQSGGFVTHEKHLLTSFRK